MTHAVKSAMPPRPDDVADLEGMRVILPRASVKALMAFEAKANQAIRELGARRGVQVIDAARVIGGHRAWFADLVHFNDQGAAEIADLIAERLRGMKPAAAPSMARTVSDQFCANPTMTSSPN